MSSVAEKRRNKARMRQAQGKARISQNVSLGPDAPWNGDHGTGTAAATAQTDVVQVTDEKGRNPNRMARRQRRDVLRDMLNKDLLSMRQWQAGDAIARAYCKVQMLSSGGELKERVQASPKPDATIHVQVSATSRLVFVMHRVHRADRALIEAVCWHNKPLRSVKIRRSGARLRETLDRVADHLGY